MGLLHPAFILGVLYVMALVHFSQAETTDSMTVDDMTTVPMVDDGTTADDSATVTEPAVDDSTDSTDADSDSTSETDTDSSEGVTEDADDVTEAVDTGVTSSPHDDGTMTMVPEPEVTTEDMVEPITCYECDGASCDSAMSTTANDNDTCTSTVGICFMEYDVTAGVVTRGCNSTNEYTESCTEAYPDGKFASNKCEYCCRTNNCNSAALTAAMCDELGDSGAVNIRSHVTLLVVFTFSAWATS